MNSTTRGAYTYQVAGHGAGTGPVVAVLTDGPADLAVAARAADLAARTRTLLVAAAAVHTGGISINPLLHRARTGRVSAESMAIVARITPILYGAGVAYLRTTLPVPAGLDLDRALPAAEVCRLASRFAAATVVTPVVLHDPTGYLRPLPHHATGIPAA